RRLARAGRGRRSLRQDHALSSRDRSAQDLLRDCGARRPAYHPRKGHRQARCPGPEARGCPARVPDPARGPRGRSGMGSARHGRAAAEAPDRTAHWQGLDPAGRRRRTLDAIKGLLLRESQAQPLALVFEDLQWIDGETQALLESLVESLPSARLLLLVSHRPEYAHAWGSQTSYTQIRIDPLPRDSAEALLDVLLGHDPGLDT